MVFVDGFPGSMQRIPFGSSIPDPCHRFKAKPNKFWTGVGHLCPDGPSQCQRIFRRMKTSGRLRMFKPPFLNPFGTVNIDFTGYVNVLLIIVMYVTNV